MTLIRFIAMQPRVQIVRDPATGIGSVVRYDNGEPVITHYEPKHTERLYDTESVARRESNAYAGRRNPNGFGRVIRLDLDEELHLDATVHEQWQHAERQLIRWTIEEARLRPADRGEPIVPAIAPADLDALREAACEWLAIRPWVWSIAGPDAPPQPRTDRALAEALAKVLPALVEKKRRESKP